jgi:hypothetical protein
MAELIAALVEAIAAIITAIVEAIPVIIETLVYVVMGAITIIAYALSRRFRERKRQEWRQRPKWKYVDLGISAACVSVLVLIGFWIFLPRSQPAPSRDSLAEDVRQGRKFRLAISGRSDQTSNQLKIEAKKEAIEKLLKSRHHAGQTVTQNSAAVGGTMDSGTNGSQPFRWDTNATPAAGSGH